VWQCQRIDQPHRGALFVAMGTAHRGHRPSWGMPIVGNAHRGKTTKPLVPLIPQSINMRRYILILFGLVSTSLLAQGEATTLITEEKAIQIAQKHTCWLNITRKGWNGWTAQLDTTSLTWNLSNSKVTYQHRGRTTKTHPSEPCMRCRDVNGCHVISIRSVFINAMTGAVISSKKEKGIYPNFE
jgi:hypothetical protein